MRKVLIASFALLVSAPDGRAQEPDGWYTMNTLIRRCARSEEGPAGLIGSMRTLGGRYRVAETVDPATGQIMRVTVTLLDLGREAIFYRGARECQAQLDVIVGAQDAQQREIEERYRIPVPPASASAGPPAPVPGSSPLSLTQGDIRQLADQISECWNVDRGILGLNSLVVEVRVQLDSQGVVRNVVPNGAAPSDPRARSIYETARRALMSPQCNPLRVPPSKYGTLMATILRFNPRGLVR